MNITPFQALACPLDGGPLRRQGTSWRCDAGHCFDIAAQGYTNLLPVQQKRSRDPGDSKEMVAARRRYLNAGFYQPIAELVSRAVLADLPGYGYAAVSRSDKERWQRVMLNYLMERESLTAVVLLCDPRLGLTELDEALLDALRPRVEQGLKFLVLLTKADKLTRAEQAKALSIMRLNAGGGEVRLFSALKKQGVDEVAQLLWQWCHPQGGAAVDAQAADDEQEPPALDEAPLDQNDQNE